MMTGFSMIYNPKKKHFTSLSKFIFFESNHKIGILNYKCEIFKKPQFENLIEISDKLFLVQKMNHTWGLLNSKGRIVIPFTKSTLIPYKSNMFIKVDNYKIETVQSGSSESGPYYKYFISANCSLINAKNQFIPKSKYEFKKIEIGNNVNTNPELYELYDEKYSKIK